MSRRTAALGLVVLLLVLLFLAVRNAGEPPDAPDTPEEGAAPEVAREEPATPAPEEQPEVGGKIEDPLGGDRPPARERDRADGRHLTGRVVRPDGTPVEGAVVMLFRRYDDIFRVGVEPIRGVDSEQPRVRTGPDGRFSIPPDAPEKLRKATWSADMNVRAEADGVASYYRSIATHLVDLEVGDLVLRPALAPEGVVVDRDAQPVAGARVALRFVYGLGPRGEGGEQYLTLADATDGEGRFRLPPVPRRDAWSMRLVVEHPEHLNVDRKVRLFKLTSGEPLRVVLSPGLIVRGRLLLPDGLPAAGYDIHVGGYRGNLSLYAVARTAEDGTFAVRGVPPRWGAVGFEKGWNDLKHKTAVPDGKDGETVDLGTIRLPGRAAIGGVVLDEDGKGVRCYVNLRKSGDYTGYKNGKIDQKGRFTFENVPPGEYVVKARHDLGDGDEIEGRVTGVKPGDEEVVVRLTRAGSVLFVFHTAERPEEPLAVPSYEISFGGRSLSGGGPTTRKRVYLHRASGEIEFTVKVPGYLKQVIGPIQVLPDWQITVDVKLTPE
ncbi:MAG: carboxypeptidase-like regulatory domain-containing protein [Planctomycetota bacterium]|jgi:hypothetical protein